MPNILMIDDHPMGTDSLLMQRGYQLIRTANCYQALQDLHMNQQIHLVILSLDFRHLDAWQLLKVFKESPKSRQTPVIVMTNRYDDALVVKALRAGADCVLRKPCHPGIVLANMEALIRRAAWNNHPVRKDKTVPMVNTDSLENTFNPRELTILQMVVLGQSNREISQRLLVSQTTVKNHLATIFAKMNVKNAPKSPISADNCSRRWMWIFCFSLPDDSFLEPMLYAMMPPH